MTTLTSGGCGVEEAESFHNQDCSEQSNTLNRVLFLKSKMTFKILSRCQACT